MKGKNIIILVLFAFVLNSYVTSGIKNESNVENSIEQVTVKAAVTIVPQLEWLEAIGGEFVDSLALIPQGQSPHTYEPTTTELVFMSEADVWFSIGLTDFDKVNKDSFIQATENPNFEFVNLSKGLELLEIESHDHEALTIEQDINVDPHTWLSPSRTITMLETIRDKLKELDPNNAVEYENNAAAYISQLTNLNNSIASRITTIEKKYMLIFHPSWGYFADDFGLEIISLEFEGKDPSSAHLVKIIDEARLHDVGVIFTQEEFSTEIAKAFAEEACLEVIRLYPLARDYITNLNWTTDILVEKLNQEPDCKRLLGFKINMVILTISLMLIPIVIKNQNKRFI